MSFSGAFARTAAVRGPVLRPVAADKVKWWAKKKACDGEITRHISAHEIHPIGPWLKTFPKKVIDRAPTYILYPGGCAVLTYGVIAAAAGASAAEERSHRW
ncbi:expressed unknown protein [Seminavis robusta]|uniref:Uncharacterized protein n=1 Tax=Seminavis robusta TaxID=568900 RepID=A0A9N8E2R4_9STRA|nr:expressed unknown protein [Seminavis robusta]CAB9525019.1 expressed unknown protein [Seminavis robusta]|eukprot:Sro1618_g286370.1 n/a (101) ;mRNA; r:2015-2521